LIIENATIVSNVEIAIGIWQMTMLAPEVSSHYRGPGQFINILSDDNWEHPVRRPMSIANVNGKNINIIYKIFGNVTAQLSQKIPGDSLNILGPLGNVFTGWKTKRTVLVGGGVGLAPILNLYESCPNSTLIIGARTADEHFMDHEPEKNIYLTTDDGSLGVAGNVLTVLENLDFNDQIIIYACGPKPMLKAIQHFAAKYSIKAQLSVESYMGCGLGLCQGCVIERQNEQMKKHSYHEKYTLVCMDGPVYWSNEVCFG
jgi:dihydroorotate dehydrogenase electron transfer subunit